MARRERRRAPRRHGQRRLHESRVDEDSTPAYLGLARAMFRVTQDCTSAARERCATIDADAAHSPTAVHAAAADCGTQPIIVEATAAGFAPVRISIPVSVDEAKDGVLPTAKATATFAGGFSYLDDFVG